MELYNRKWRHLRNDGRLEALAVRGMKCDIYPDTPNCGRRRFHCDSDFRWLAIGQSSVVIAMSVPGWLGLRVAVLLPNHQDRKDPRTNWAQEWAACSGNRARTRAIAYLPVQNPFPNHSLFCRRQKLLNRSDLSIPV